MGSTVFSTLAPSLVAHVGGPRLTSTPAAHVLLDVRWLGVPASARPTVDLRSGVAIALAGTDTTVVRSRVLGWCVTGSRVLADVCRGISVERTGLTYVGGTTTPMTDRKGAVVVRKPFATSMRGSAVAQGPRTWRPPV